MEVVGQAIACYSCYTGAIGSFTGGLGKVANYSTICKLNSLL